MKSLFAIMLLIGAHGVMPSAFATEGKAHQENTCFDKAAAKGVDNMAAQETSFVLGPHLAKGGEKKQVLHINREQQQDAEFIGQSTVWYENELDRVTKETMLCAQKQRVQKRELLNQDESQFLGAIFAIYHRLDNASVAEQSFFYAIMRLQAFQGLLAERQEKLARIQQQLLKVSLIIQGQQTAQKLEKAESFCASYAKVLQDLRLAIADKESYINSSYERYSQEYQCAYNASLAESRRRLEPLLAQQEEERKEEERKEAERKAGLNKQIESEHKGKHAAELERKVIQVLSNAEEKSEALQREINIMNRWIIRNRDMQELEQKPLGIACIWGSVMQRMKSEICIWLESQKEDQNAWLNKLKTISNELGIVIELGDKK